MPEPVPHDEAAAERWFSTSGTMPTSLFVALVVLVLIETVAVHLWLRIRHPVWAWSLTSLSVLSLAWMIRERRCQREAGVAISAQGLELRGGPYQAKIPHAMIGEVVAVGWREVPAEPPKGFVNLASPLTPTVRIDCHEAVKLRMSLGLSRSARQLALRIDDTQGFLDAWQTKRSAIQAPVKER